MKFPFNGEVLKRYIYPNLPTLQRANSDFGPITLLNVESKHFFNLVSKHLEAPLIHNKFINNYI